MANNGLQKYSKKLREEFYELLRTGNTITDSCSLTGITRNSYYEWIAKYPEFEAGCKQAEADFIKSCTDVIAKEIPTNPKLALKVLERRRKADWGASTSVEISNKDDKAFVTANADLDKLTKEQFERILDVIEETTASDE